MSGAGGIAAPVRCESAKGFRHRPPRRKCSGEALADVLHELVILRGARRRRATKMVTVTVEARQAAGERVPHCPVDRQFAAGQDRNCRRGRQLGPHRRARRRQGRRACWICDKLEISFGDIRVATQGERDPAYSEAATSAYMKNFPRSKCASGWASAPAWRRSIPAI